MSEIMEEIAELEQNIKAAKELKGRRDMAIKLSKNVEFRKIFIEGWFKDEAARLIQMASDPRVNKDIQASCQEEARATGFARRYLSDMVQMGAKAENDLPEMEKLLDELRAQAINE